MYDQIEQQLDVLAKEASRGDGNSYHWYCQRFTSAVDGFVNTLPETQRDHATKLAKARGYGEEDRGENDCVHGLDPDCCSAGCGDRDDECYYYDDDDDSPEGESSSEEPRDLMFRERIETKIALQTLLAQYELLTFVDDLRGHERHSRVRAEHLSHIIEFAGTLCSKFDGLSRPFDHPVLGDIVSKNWGRVANIDAWAREELDETVALL